MDSFLKVALKSLRTTGTIKPSSAYLVRDCLKDIDFNKAKTIIEFGPGDGCMTERIAPQLVQDAHLYAFELNDRFYHHCNHRFSHEPAVTIVHANALDFKQVLADHQIDKVDHVVSSLPLTLLSKSDTQTLLERVASALRPGGYFIQFQYSFGSYPRLRRVFDEVKLDITWRNLPPAVIYKCRLLHPSD